MKTNLMLDVAALLVLARGTMVRMTTRMKSGTRVEVAYVTWREEVATGCYFGFEPVWGRKDSVRCMWGCSTLRSVGNERPFGLQSVELEESCFTESVDYADAAARAAGVGDPYATRYVGPDAGGDKPCVLTAGTSAEDLARYAAAGAAVLEGE